MNNDCKITIDKIEQSGDHVFYQYHVSGKWAKYFNLDNLFYLEYDQPLSDMPYEILALPFVGNIIVFSWLFDAEIILESIDSDFVKSLAHIRNEYAFMYPSLKFYNGKLTGKMIKHTQANERSAILFSGGLDSLFTLIQHQSVNPLMITYQWHDEGKNRLISRTKEVAELFNNTSVCIKTNVRNILHQSLVDELVQSTHNTYWHNLQHSLALLCMAAPSMFYNKASTLYIASGMKKSKMVSTCASNPNIDNYLHFAGCDIIHDGIEFDRQAKIALTCKYLFDHHIKLIIGVCAHSTADKINCSICPKCYRTILEITSEGYDPNDFGFVVNDQLIKAIKHRLLYKDMVNQRHINEYYHIIKRRFWENKAIIKDYQRYAWIQDINVDKLNDNLIKKAHQLLFKISISMSRVKRRILMRVNHE